MTLLYYLWCEIVLNIYVTKKNYWCQWIMLKNVPYKSMWWWWL